MNLLPSECLYIVELKKERWTILDEETIVRQMIAGDMDAFGELMKQYEKPALRAAWLISGNAADSEDIVQEAFTICYLNRKKLRDPAQFRTWFYRILTRTAWKLCKKTGREARIRRNVYRQIEGSVK